MVQRPLRVLLLAWDFPPAKGGIQVWMYELARRLPDAEVRVLAPDIRGASRFDADLGIHVRRLGGAGWGPSGWGFGLAFATIRAVLSGPPDVIVCSHVLTGPAALVTRLLFGVPYVVFCHGHEVRRGRWKGIINLVLGRATAVVANSRFMSTSLTQRGIPEKKIKLLHPGVDPQRFTPATTCGATSSGRGKKLLTVSRLQELYKGHDTVIRALPLILARCPDAHYVIAGSGRLQRYLLELARSVGVDAHVTFLGDVSDDQLPNVYRECDLVLQISRQARSGGGVEGFGIVCLEAAATAKAVVAGRSGGLPDAVVDGVTGLLVDPDDVADVADGIIVLLERPEYTRVLGVQGRDRAVREFTWDQMARRAWRLLAEAARLQPSAQDSHA